MALAKMLIDAGMPTLSTGYGGRDTPPQSAEYVKRSRRGCRRPLRSDADRPLLRDGSRQALGAGRESLQLPSSGRWPHFADRLPASPMPMQKQFDEFIVPAVVGDYRG